MSAALIIKLVLIIAVFICIFVRIPMKKQRKDNEWAELIMFLVIFIGFGCVAFILDDVYQMGIAISGICEAVKLFCVFGFIAAGVVTHLVDKDRSREFFEKHMVLQSIVSIIVFIGFGGLFQIIMSR